MHKFLPSEMIVWNITTGIDQFSHQGDHVKSSIIKNKLILMRRWPTHEGFGQRKGSQTDLFCRGLKKSLCAALRENFWL